MRSARDLVEVAPLQAGPRGRGWRVAVAGTALALGALTDGRALHAQTLRLRFEEAETRKPIPGIIASLIDSAGTRRAPALADADGRVTLEVPGPGIWVVRADRVGFATWESSPLPLRAGEVREMTARVPTRATTLETVVVRGQTSCERELATSERSALLWAEARKALESSDLALRRPRQMQVRRYERFLDVAGRVEQERLETESRRTLHAFRSPPANELSAQGWVTQRGDELTWHGPDAAVLLSESFARDHCFRLVEDGAHPGWVGLAFEPHRRRRVPDIAGTIWLARDNSALREVNYRYVNAGEYADLTAAGGRIVFSQLRDGQWFVESWEIRAPRHATRVGARTVREAAADRDTLIGIKLDGGAVLAVAGDAEEQPVVPGSVVVRGMVRDSLTGAPLAGVVTELAGTVYTDTTDESGSFRLVAPLSGRYVLTFRHERLALARIFDARQELQLSAGDSLNVGLLLPTVAARRARWCPAGTWTPPRAAFAAGLVVDSTTGAPIAGASARARFASGAPVPTGGVLVRGTQTEEATTDHHGWFLWCDLPPDAPLEIVVEAEGYRPWKGQARLAPESLDERVIRLVPNASRPSP
jgi:hypothetical protein